MDRYSRKQLEKALYNLALQDMQISLFYDKFTIVNEIRKLSDTDLLQAITVYFE